MEMPTAMIRGNSTNIKENTVPGSRAFAAHKMCIRDRQIGSLEYKGEIADQTIVAVLPHVPSAKAHAAALHIPEPRH